MTYIRSTIDALEGRTKRADVIVLESRAHIARRVRSAKNELRFTISKVARNFAWNISRG